MLNHHQPALLERRPSRRARLWVALISTARFELAVLTGALVSGSTALGEPKVVIVGSPHAAVTQGTDGLVAHSFAAAAANRQGLQVQIDNNLPKYPRFFPSPTVASLAQYFFDSTVEIPNGRSGEAWVGVGGSDWGGVFAKYGSQLCLRASTHGTRFNGAEKTASASDGSAVVTVVGRTVTARDVDGALEITGGANFEPGWYAILDYNEVDNTWTLDRDCTDVDGGDASAMTGWYCPTMLRNHGLGTEYRSLVLNGQYSDGDVEFGEYGTIAIHVCTPQNSGGMHTGKHRLDNLNINNFLINILVGRDIREASLTPGVASGGAAAGGGTTDWVGRNDAHADLMSGENIRFRNTKCGWFVRNEQSVGHDYTHVKVGGLDGWAYFFDAGGKLSVDGLDMSGSGSGTRQCALRLGIRANWGHSPYMFRRVCYDGGTNTRNPQLVVTDWAGHSKRATVTFDGVCLNRSGAGENGGPPYDEGIPLIDVQSKTRVVVRDLGGGSRGIWEESILLGQGGTASEAPTVILENCELEITGDDPTVVVDPASAAGATVIFKDCYRFSDGARFENTVWPAE